jgi:hypothetical protein
VRHPFIGCFFYAFCHEGTKAQDFKKINKKKTWCLNALAARKTNAQNNCVERL